MKVKFCFGTDNDKESFILNGILTNLKEENGYKLNEEEFKTILELMKQHEISIRKIEVI